MVRSRVARLVQGTGSSRPGARETGLGQASILQQLCLMERGMFPREAGSELPVLEIKRAGCV